MRKKQAMHLDARYVTMVENAYYYCNPPPAEKTVKKKRPPLQEYIRKLLYKDLSKVTTEKVNLFEIFNTDFTGSDVILTFEGFREGYNLFNCKEEGSFLYPWLLGSFISFIVMHRSFNHGPAFSHSTNKEWN